MNDLLKKGLCEAIGTFVLVFFSCGVAAITGGSLVATALTFGLSLIAMAYSIGRISGCHINPAVSLACLITKRMSVKEFFVYILCQVVGGFIGGMLIFGICKTGDLRLMGDACNYTIGYAHNGVTAMNVIASLVTEIVLTAVFVGVILNVTSKKSPAPKLAGVIIGFTLTLVHLLGINLTGTSVNPARSIATALSAAIFNGEFAGLQQLWIFIVGPLLGALLGGFIYIILHQKDDQEPITE